MIAKQDPADSPEASCLDTYVPLEALCPKCGQPGEAVCPHCAAGYQTKHCLCDHCQFRASTPQVVAQRFARLARLISSKRNAKFWWACLMVATGDAAAGGVSMADLGKRFSVTRAYVSKTCVLICALLNLPPSRYMMSEAGRTVHRTNNRRNTKP